MTTHDTLAAKIRGPVLEPGDEGYDDERTGFQLAGPHRPDVVVGALDAADVRAAVEYAAGQGLPVAVQNTGHGLPRGMDGGLLVSTRRMTGLRVDPEARTARIEAGVRWSDVVPEAAAHGLAPLSGSAPGVGAVSYVLGGGIGLMSRAFGNAADHVRSLEVVTADARLRHVTPDGDPDLFWALLGGRANFGVVTSLEIGLVPVERLYGGGLYFDTELIPAVLETWRTWTTAVPDAMTSSIALMPVPDAPVFPEPLRGRRVAHVRIAYVGDAAEGERLIAPLRAVGPRLIDAVADMPYTESGTIHNEPPIPMAYRATNLTVDEIGADTTRTLLDLAGDRAIVEVRQLGGALAAAPPHPTAVGNRDAAYLIGVLTKLDGDPLHERAEKELGRASSGRLLNFLFGAAATPERVREAFDPSAYRRLRELKAAYDPSNLFRLNHNIPPAS
ncbi:MULTISPECIES: FAD-binding oxidoreductase [Actinomadura]|uniref:FAD-binding protein n=1 Tax=Actinomadura litoris TaxID=2678616 RepID=A0A7K1LAG2_9ACTN|nr:MULTISPECIES: FAD-binding oxidoreductase [Actinomadura]MBT2207138.1 FAD-binding oxidoreductase [Actinomadura sp. NEAU-AAG7]MUN41175.1 FAD-binding protein [Actinomadura litoris]